VNSEQRKGRFGVSWRLLVTLASVSLTFCFVLWTIIYFIDFRVMRSSYAYQEAMVRTRSSPDVIRELGEPIEPEWIITGVIKTGGSFGSARLVIPVSGAKNSGTVYVIAIKNMDKWSLSSLEIGIEGKAERINLLTQTR
jgi:hypothetical protein